MNLQEYRRKRVFSQTPEPEGQAATGGGPLRFVVQMHKARRLHYDFRLELDGTLKSWAVPKGPSLNPEDKRLAVMVEDHPLEYRTFEGVIPQGNYGAGTVMVWDEGIYQARGARDPDRNVKLLREGLAKGDLKIILAGKKLKGEFALVKIRKDDKNWLLIKKRDRYASDQDVLGQDRSAATGRTMDEIAAQAPSRGELWQPNLDLGGAPRGEMPHDIKPMLACPADEPFDKPGWLFEIKWDGYRAIAEVARGKVRLYSRTGLSFTERYAPVAEALARLNHEAVLDGEVVVLDARGRPNFQLLQNYLKSPQGPLVYFLFDLLYLDGHDLCSLPLTRRKELLSAIVPPSPHLRLSEHVEEQGVAFFQALAKQNLEGMVAKRAASIYRPGRRSHDWLKIKTDMRQEAVIAGFTEGQGHRKSLGAVVLGVYDDNQELVYCGHAGTGFTDQSLADLRRRLEPLIQKKCPFKTVPVTNAPAKWVKPVLVCQVKFTSWSRDGHMRHPVFMGLREDKPAREVRREEAEATPAADGNDGEKKRNPVQAAETPRKNPNSGVNEDPSPFPQSAIRNPKPEIPRRGGKGDGLLNIAGRDVRLTNLGKVYWPGEGYTKGDLIAYYQEVAPVILPYLKDRPQSLNRHPNGITGKNFFQKDVAGKVPDWVQTVAVFSESNNADITFLLCQDAATLIYMANLGCIELNPWSSRTGSLERPDYLVIDLDPEAVAFEHVVTAALVVRQVCESAGAPCFCKTSGKRGLHVYVPLAARYDYDQARMFAEVVVSIVRARLPQVTSLERSPSRRQGKVYLDWLQNRRGQTLAAPYSVRPTPHAKVSTPLLWQEVKPGLDPAGFTIKTIARRLDRVGDLWQPVLGQGIDLKKCLERLGGKALSAITASGTS